MTIRQQIYTILQSILADTLKFSKAIKIEIDCPKDRRYGDYSTNLALKLSNNRPLAIAESLKQPLQKKGKQLFEKIEIVKPGFVNLFLSHTYLQSQVKQMLTKKDKFFQNRVGKSQEVQLEFISANPTGPLTVGNARGGYLGDVLAKVFSSCGYKVTKEYLINDAGSQIESLGHSVLKDDSAVYQGEYIDKLHQEIPKDEPAKVGQRAAKTILNEYIKKTIGEKMNIKFDVWYSEQKEIRNKKKIEKLIAWLKKRSQVYQKDEALWFKSTNYGDDKDRVLIRKNGEPGYFAQDFAYHKDKFDRGFAKVINIWGADHHGDVKRLKAAAEVLGHPGKLEIILTQFIRLIKDGKEVRMSKRAGNLVYLDDLINEVGPDATRFYFLKYSADSHIDFDLNLAKERSEKNPVYYIQYAYARICSILRQNELKTKPKKIKLEFNSEYELNLIKELIKLPDLLIAISDNYQVQNLTQFATNLADNFHQFYTNCRVIDKNKVNWSRVKLIQATQITLKNLFNILGIAAPEKM